MIVSTSILTASYTELVIGHTSSDRPFQPLLNHQHCIPRDRYSPQVLTSPRQTRIGFSVRRNGPAADFSDN